MFHIIKLCSSGSGDESPGKVPHRPMPRGPDDLSQTSNTPSNKQDITINKALIYTFYCFWWVPLDLDKGFLKQRHQTRNELLTTPHFSIALEYVNISFKAQYFNLTKHKLECKSILLHIYTYLPTVQSRSESRFSPRPIFSW